MSPPFILSITVITVTATTATATRITAVCRRLRGIPTAMITTTATVIRACRYVRNVTANGNTTVTCARVATRRIVRLRVII